MDAIRVEQRQPTGAAICDVMNLFETGAARLIVDGDMASFKEVQYVLRGLDSGRAKGRWVHMPVKPISNWVNKALFALCVTFIISLVLMRVRLNVRGQLGPPSVC
jgi:hypothetical protein